MPSKKEIHVFAPGINRYAVCSNGKRWQSRPVCQTFINCAKNTRNVGKVRARNRKKGHNFPIKNSTPGSCDCIFCCLPEITCLFVRLSVSCKMVSFSGKRIFSHSRGEKIKLGQDLFRTSTA